MSTKLAHIEEVKWTRQIAGTDNIELVGILGWQCIAKKGEFHPGDKCVYIEIDSIVDKNNPVFSFLEPRGFKIKTIKMRGVLSQGIAFPISILPQKKEYHIGDDVTTLLKVEKIQDVAPENFNENIGRGRQRKKQFKSKMYKWLQQFEWFRRLMKRFGLKKNGTRPLPNWIHKTDEIRIQEIPDILTKHYVDEHFFITEKLDGTSTSFGVKKIGKNKYDFVVCSRNLQQPKNASNDNIYHQIAKKYNIRDALIDLIKDDDIGTTIVLQGETIGEKIQSNRYKIKGNDFYAFNLIQDGYGYNPLMGEMKLKHYGIKWVPILDVTFDLFPTVEEMIAYADGMSLIGDTLREGIVVRNFDSSISFKCVSNKYLLKYKL